MRAIWTLYRKEIREFARDKRVFVGAILLPMALVVVIASFMGVLHGYIEKPRRSEIAVMNPELGSLVLRHTSASGNFEVIRVASVDEGLKLVKEKKVKLFVVFSSPLRSALEQGKKASVRAYLDKKSLPAQLALGKLEAAVQAVNTQRRSRVLNAYRLTETDLEPIRIETVPATEAEEFGGDLLSSLLPYLLVVFAFFGGVSLAGDSVAGEKERGTLETLLVCPASRLHISLGKILSMATVCAASACSGLVGLLMVLIPGVGIARQMVQGGLHVSMGSVLACLVAMIPLVFMFAAVLVAISTFSRNQREANTYASAISFLVMVPAIASQFVGFTDMGSSTWIGLIPVLNTATVLRQILLGELDVLVFGITMLTSVLLAALALAFAVRMFLRESVLMRT